MKKILALFFFLFFLFSRSQSQGVVADFSIPDTVCINNSVNITNISTGASTYYWNFCLADINTTPVAQNLGNIGGVMTSPVYIDYVFDNGNYYGFVADNHTGNLLRLNFGNSLLNTPSIVNFGNLGGVIPINLEGIQVVQNEGKWYAILVGGDLIGAGVEAYIIKVEFGADITNPNPVATNWGNLGNMSYPHDLYVFNDNGIWYGFTANTNNNTITRFDFSSRFSNTPVATNLGNIGGLASPTGLYAISDNGNWYVFVTNAGVSAQTSLTRLDFGSSLLNTPTGINLGNPGNHLNIAWDISLIKSCGNIYGYAINATNQLLKLDFGGNITNIPSISSLGNIGNLSFPHCLSKLFRVGPDIFTFIANVDNSSITRIRFPGCTNSSIPNSSLQNPPPITYSAPGTYNINLTIDDGLPTQSSFCKQVVVVDPPQKSPIAQFSICDGQTIRIGKAPVDGITYTWSNGVISDSIDVSAPGLYWVDMSIAGCSSRDSMIVVKKTGDFSFAQDVCNPLQVQFTNAIPQTSTLNWDFGNGNTNNDDNNPATVYPVAGNYTVSLHTITANGCELTVEKSISIQITIDSLITTRDTTLCPGAKLRLNALQALKYCWSPAAGLSATDIANPVADAPVSTMTYYLHSLLTGNNLITNGDFSQGNTGFTSEYHYAGANVTEGEYFTGTNPQSWNSNLSPCADHTSGNGQMMLVNGSPVADVNVWKQTVTITPNTNYAFSTWIQALWPPNPAQLQFSINGNTIGDLITASLPTCTWTQFYTTWNSGNNTTAEISIVNKNTQIQGNDFALDDISFAPVFIKMDSVIIDTENPIVKANDDTTVCAGASVSLNATGSMTYAWSPAAGLTNANIPDPVATLLAAAQFIVTGTSANGCKAKDTVNITVNPKPVISKSQDSLICKNSSVQLFAGGGAAYSWSPQSGLDNSSVANPIASPASNTTYKVTVTDANNCSNTDSVKITIRPDPIFTINADTSICSGTSVRLSAKGGDTYSWQPSAALNNPSIANPVAAPSANTAYSVLITDTVCGNSKTLSTTIVVLPSPTVKAAKSNDIDCSRGSSQLSATGATGYEWSPSSFLSNPFIANPVSTTTEPVKYVVVGTNPEGCSNSDSILVDVKAINKGLYFMPSAFTPNGDGKNDCYSAKTWGFVTDFDFSIFNRWGERVFHSTIPTQCWDGTYKGVPQKADVYVYIIRAKSLCESSIFRKGTVALIR